MINHNKTYIEALCQAVGVEGFEACNFSSIPCIEVSDSERLCKEPLVSVRLITYNHELWIAEAIESVVSQKTSFPFELIIAEDCSTDATRAICLEYQKKYPHIIRVIYSDSNVGLRFNSIRADQQVRGQFVALLEGDDYWVDEHKLQKQYELMLQHPDALVSMACTRVSNPNGQYGMKDGLVLCPDKASGQTLTFSDFTRFYLHTSTYFFSPQGFQYIKELAKKYCLYDSIMYFYLSSISSVPCTQEVVSVYRITDQGIYAGASLGKRAKQELYVVLALMSSIKGYNDFLCDKLSAYLSRWLYVQKESGEKFSARLQIVWIALKLLLHQEDVKLYGRISYSFRIAKRMIR